MHESDRESSPTTSAKILVADDDFFNRKYYREVLKREGYVVDEVSSGEEAIDSIAKNDYELILSDLQMYKIGGLDVLRAAKERNPNTQVVIMTGYGSIPTAVKSIQQGAFDYLPKPVTRDMLLMHVRKAIEQRELQLRLQEQQQRLELYKKMIERDLKLAEKVQASLVPKNFENENIAVAIQYHPTLGIGGDFCSIYNGSRDHVHLNMVDVTGHGIAAALIVNRVSNELNNILKTNPKPQNILSSMNTFFYDTFGNMGLFLTMMSLHLDFAKRILTYAGGAHPAALFFCAREKSLSLLASKNTIIGFDKSPQNKFSQDKKKFEPGDKIVVYTDGLLEAEDKEKHEFGIHGLLASANAHITEPVVQASEHIIQDVCDFRDDFHRDDIMIMIVEIL
ncbi:fused response regulator/phosphatase [candidate division KSB1 bacterium]|nr:SpoIIE family protein phosphatase [candidate division KSB1 bacterium]RQW07130.1 MAG: fused response regulator/phosphatase [candidate division KSB1 bacterium]